MAQPWIGAGKAEAQSDGSIKVTIQTTEGTFEFMAWPGWLETLAERMTKAAAEGLEVLDRERAAK